MFPTMRPTVQPKNLPLLPSTTKRLPEKALPTKDCSFCPCLLETNYRQSTTEDQCFVFHKECQSCSSPNATQIPLCDFCKHLRLGHLVKCIWRYKSWDKFSIDLDPKARALSRTKCDLCDFITDATSFPQTGPSEDEFILANSAKMEFNAGWDVRITGRRGTSMLEYFVMLKNKNPQVPPSTLINPGQLVRWDTIRGWLTENLNSSDVLDPEENPPPGFHVIDVNNRCVVEKKRFCKYMALSYVWGSRSGSACYVEQATRENIESLKVPGGLTNLPDTIEDAITMCQRLGIKYLWADRYCIIQDHAVHKHTQVAAMAFIYAYALLTLIACSGKDGVESGIPGVRRERQWKRRCINIQGVTFTYLFPHLNEIIQRSIWNTRGWTYQEAILSQRRLIMTPLEAWFQSEGRTFREHSLYWDTESPPRVLNMNQIPTDFEQYAPHVISYTKRRLGYASDIYNAFDGIAYALNEEEHVFHFGLLESSFDHALLWFCRCRWNDARSRCLRACAEVTPSWSWGSVTCQVLYDLDSFCIPLVKWVIYKAQGGDMSSQNTDPEAIEIKEPDDTDGWTDRSLVWSEKRSPLLFALAINEGCIEAGEGITIPDHESFFSLEENFSRRWPTYEDACEDVRQVDTPRSPGPHGVLFTNAQSAFFHIKSKWIQNASGMIIGFLRQMDVSDYDDDDNYMFWDSYEECSVHEECSADEECNIEGIALSISAVQIEEMLREINSDIPPQDEPPKEAYRDMTYFDCHDTPLCPAPGVNIMFIHREYGYARRIGLGWIALKQWGSFEWTLKDIWLK